MGLQPTVIQELRKQIQVLRREIQCLKVEKQCNSNYEGLIQVPARYYEYIQQEFTINWSIPFIELGIDSELPFLRKVAKIFTIRAFSSTGQPLVYEDNSTENELVLTFDPGAKGIVVIGVI